MSAPIQGLRRRLPWYLQGPVAGAFIESALFALDLQVQTFREGILASRPFDCEEDALPQLAVDRRLRLYPTEPIASQRYRLSRWRQLHRRRGTHRGELEHLQPYFLPGGLPTLRIVHVAGDASSATWHTLAPNGTYSVSRFAGGNWNWDNVTTKWSRYWLIVYLDGTDVDGGLTEWGDGSAWDGPQLWDGDPRADQIADIIQIVTDWQSAHSQLWGVLLVRDPAALDPAGSAVALPDGSTTYPQGNWWHFSDETTGRPTRPTSIEVVYNLGHG